MSAIQKIKKIGRKTSNFFWDNSTEICIIALSASGFALLSLLKGLETENRRQQEEIEGLRQDVDWLIVHPRVFEKNEDGSYESKTLSLRTKDPEPNAS